MFEVGTVTITTMRCLNLHLPMFSVKFCYKIHLSNSHTQQGVLDTTLYDIVDLCLGTGTYGFIFFWI
jgi:hypothetical protein